MKKDIYCWKKAPFIRLLIPLMAGIILQWHLQYDRETWWAVFLTGILVAGSFYFFPLFKKFQYRFLNGLAIILPFIALGALLVWHQDARHRENWIGYRLHNDAFVTAILSESPVEKTRSFKSNATLLYQVAAGKIFPIEGKIIIYFKKDSLPRSLQYGFRIVFKKPLQEIKNQGNPGGFDYKRYALFQGITHQVYLQPGEFTVLTGANKKWLPALLEKIRETVLSILRNNIRGEKELGLAEALLIGYKDDLDKTLVQSYTNTGVVHIIAISGLHLGLIYWLLVGLLKPLQRKKYGKWLRPLVIIAGLWLFSLLAGAQPSILRSAVMFTCIVLGENLSRKTSIYNTLALSAFLLLCYNPYWLWDIGFQLSYSAVLSIVVFMQPVYNIVYIKNKLLDLVWKMNAVTIAAQILTLPVSVYHFHQLPTLFLFTNFVAVPLSSIILLGEIFVCCIFFIPSFASLLGKLISWLITMMNSYIEKIEKINFSLWDGLQINLFQVVLLFVFIAGISYWLIERSRRGLLYGLMGLSVFFSVRALSFREASRQLKIIVYNVPRYQAIDFIKGRRYFFEGDSILTRDASSRNFYLQPCRTLHRLGSGDSISHLKTGHFIFFARQNILLADKSLTYTPSTVRIPIDLLIISQNPRLSIPNLDQIFDVKKIVFDGSIPDWKLRRWKGDCDTLHIPYHDVNEKGAFVMNLN